MRIPVTESRARYLAMAFAMGALSFVPLARADEPIKANEPHYLAEPGEITDVVDAFDGDDMFDLHLTIGYQYSWKNSNIRRETAIGGAANPGLTSGGFTASNMNV